ncbi:MAG: inositol monophosphatase family protein [Chloroflexota bacterium]|nr:inositol monophosphatase family protein [Chloroflexota bacterium]
MTATSDLDSYLEVAVEAVRAAEAEIRGARDQPRQARYKGFRDVVTDTDLRAERAIVETIRVHFPDHGFRTEESPDERADFLWLVDPLDGTTNFAHGYPLFSISLALRHGDETLVGVVCDPIQDTLFTAQVGEGAWLTQAKSGTSNRRRLQVSEHDRLEDALVGLDWARVPKMRQRSVACVAALSSRVATMRALGSAVLALCGVAAGWLEGYFNLALYDWDVAAAELLIREAGGLVTDLGGNPWHPGTRGCLASNGHLHEELLTILGEV